MERLKYRYLNLIVLAVFYMSNSMHAMHKSDHEHYGRIPMHIELYRQGQWKDYCEHGNPKNTDAIATHDHVVEALTLIHEPCDSLIQRHNYWEVKSEQEMEHESMKYVKLLKEDFDKRTENFSELNSRFKMYKSNFDDFVMAVGYKQLIEKRMEQEQKPDNFNYWQLRDYVRALASRISAHKSWLGVVRRTGEEHYGCLNNANSSRELAESLNRFRTDDPKIRKDCWNQWFKHWVLDNWKMSYVSNREDNVARMLSPESVATIQAVINRGYEDTTDDNDSDDSSDYESEDENEEIEPNNLLLGINGWRD